MHGDRKHIRLPGWDYSTEGVYFITICCHDRESFFGRLIDNKMILSVIGEMASRFWKEIPEHFNHVRLDEFVIMPNHIHGIIILDYSLVGKRNIMHESPVGTRHGVSLQSNNIINVGSCHGMTLRQDGINKFSNPVKNSISVIINQYKSSLKRWCNKNGYNSFKWQSRFFDHIIRDGNSFDQIREYIRSNPKNWLSDEMFK
jgi:REP element-mobilizing transposase RayT